MDNNFKLHSISHLIGNTPLLAIEFFFKGEKRIIYAKAENINMTDSIKMAQKLASNLGIGVGISSGANFIGALMKQNEMGKDAVVVTVFPDDNKKYLSTDLLKSEPLKENFLSPHIELLGFNAYKRVCHTCCDPLTCIEADYDQIDAIQLPPCPRRIRQL